MLPGPAYRIHTARLVIRCWEPRDASALKEGIDGSLDHLRKWMPWAAFEPTDLQIKIDRIRRWRGQFDLGQDFVYGLFSLDESQVLGGSGLHTRAGEGAREIGYWIRKEAINQGLATEAAAALTRIAFEVDGVRRVEIHCDPENLPSAAVPRKLGYTHDGTLRARLMNTSGEPRGSMIWSLLAEEYPTSPSAFTPLQAFDAAGRPLLLRG